MISSLLLHQVNGYLYIKLTVTHRNEIINKVSNIRFKLLFYNSIDYISIVCNC